MPLTAGDKLGPYEIISLIGKGGMGEVYRAHDPRTGRDVAIKVSAERFSERFDREVRAVAALNHPNICTLFDVGPNYLVMEFIEGEAPKGPMPLETAMTYARQIAAALEEAHEKGIIHRDLKPGNIKIKPDGTVKVLDFGLAKMGGTPATPSENSPTISMAATQAGLILGTAAYMAPEQAKGKPADKRADIWAFGVVLHEMLTGERLFEHDDLTETLAAVVMKAPELVRAPVEMQRLLKKCLEKDPKKRLRDLGDAWELLEIGTAGSPPAEARPATRWMWPVVAAVLTVALAAVAFLHFGQATPESPVLRTTILPPQGAEFDFTQGAGLPAISPDGKKIVFGAKTADGKEPLWVRSLDGMTAQPLAGTEGALFPFWKPDSQWIAFFADGKLKKINAAGGAAITLTDVSLLRGGSWNQNDVIIFGVNPQAEIQRVSAAGGAATAVSKDSGRFPSFLPDGQHFIFQDQRGNQAVTLKIGSLDGAPTMELKTVGNASTNALYAQGNLLYLREGTLMAQPFDTKTLATIGEAVPIAEQVESVLNSRTIGAFSASQTGLLAFRAGAQGAVRAGGPRGLQLTWFDRQGKVISADAGDYQDPVLSPDGTQVAFNRIDPSNGKSDVWVHEFTRGTNTRLTADPATDAYGVWSPDGGRIVFISDRDGNFTLYQKGSSGAGAEELLLKSAERKTPDDWSHDGKFLLFTNIDPKTGPDLWYLRMDAKGQAAKPEMYLKTEFQEVNARFSPDGRFVAYQSNETGSMEVYVRTFPDPNGGKWTVSRGGGGIPHWRKDGKELFFLSLADGRGGAPGGRGGPAGGFNPNSVDLMAVDVTMNASGSFKAGAPRALFRLPPGPNPFDVSADGQKFIKESVPGAAPAASDAAAPPPPSAPITLVFNWAPTGKK